MWVAGSSALFSSTAQLACSAVVSLVLLQALCSGTGGQRVCGSQSLCVCMCLVSCCAIVFGTGSAVVGVCAVRISGERSSGWPNRPIRRVDETTSERRRPSPSGRPNRNAFRATLLQLPCVLVRPTLPGPTIIISFVEDRDGNDVREATPCRVPRNDVPFDGRC